MCNKWIPVGDSLPDTNAEVNIVIEMATEVRVTSGCRAKRYNEIVWYDGADKLVSKYYQGVVTHWQPLPEAPYTPVIVATNQDGNDV